MIATSFGCRWQQNQYRQGTLGGRFFRGCLPVALWGWALAIGGCWGCRWQQNQYRQGALGGRFFRGCLPAALGERLCQCRDATCRVSTLGHTSATNFQENRQPVARIFLPPALLSAPSASERLIKSPPLTPTLLPKQPRQL